MRHLVGRLVRAWRLGVGRGVESPRTRSRLTRRDPRRWRCMHTSLSAVLSSGELRCIRMLRWLKETKNQRLGVNRLIKYVLLVIKCITGMAALRRRRCSRGPPPRRLIGRRHGALSSRRLARCAIHGDPAPKLRQAERRQRRSELRSTNVYVARDPPRGLQLDQRSSGWGRRRGRTPKQVRRR